MTPFDTIIQENRDYWTVRAASYSREIRDWEFLGEGYQAWLQTIQGRIAAHFGGRAPEEIRVLDIATGPGFFARTTSGFSRIRMLRRQRTAPISG